MVDGGDGEDGWLCRVSLDAHAPRVWDELAMQSCTPYFRLRSERSVGLKEEEEEKKTRRAEKTDEGDGWYQSFPGPLSSLPLPQRLNAADVFNSAR